jgi:hypothetical protein
MSSLSCFTPEHPTGKMVCSQILTRHTPCCIFPSQIVAAFYCEQMTSGRYRKNALAERRPPGGPGLGAGLRPVYQSRYTREWVWGWERRRLQPHWRGLGRRCPVGAQAGAGSKGVGGPAPVVRPGNGGRGGGGGVRDCGPATPGRGRAAMVRRLLGEPDSESCCLLARGAK